MGEVIRFSIECDLNRTSIDEAVRMLGPNDPPVMLVAGSGQTRWFGWHEVATLFQTEYGCMSIELPADMLVTPYAWAVLGRDKVVLSLPLP